MVTCASAGSFPSPRGDDEFATRRRFILVMEMLGVREVCCGADDCFVGDELRRRFEAPAGNVSRTEADVVRCRRGPDRRG